MTVEYGLSIVDLLDLSKNHQPFCNLCPDEHERKCRCSHQHSVHIFAGGCVECWQEFKKGKRNRIDVCECYDARKKAKVV